MVKKLACFLIVFYSGFSFAGIPADNLYSVKKRTYAAEPQLQQFTVSAEDKAYLVKPGIDTYTHFNPGNSKALYTISAYPDTAYMPKLGKWMTIKTLNTLPTYQYPKGTNPAEQATILQPVSAGLVPAHWISLSNARGQYILEPINFVFVVYEQDPKKAADKLHALMQKVGFTGTASEDHSGGYSAYIGDQLLGQLKSPGGLGFTYSNNDFRYQNDHFRIFGAYPTNIKGQTAYLFAASVSEESGYESDLAKLSVDQIHVKLNEMSKQNPQILYYENTGHHFVSFGNARNNLAVALIHAGCPTYYSALGNVVNSPGESTEDHDGNVYVSVLKP